MNLSEFLESQVNMKMSRKFARIGSEVRCSKPYLNQLFRLTYKGYDVFEQIRYDENGTGLIRFAALPQSLLAEVAPTIVEIEFKWMYNPILGVTLIFESKEDTDDRQLAAMMEKHHEDATAKSPTDPESGSDESAGLLL